MLESCFPSTVDCAFANFFRPGESAQDLAAHVVHMQTTALKVVTPSPVLVHQRVSNYAFVYPRTSDFELGAKFESGVETEILVRVGLELLLDQNSFCETPLRCGR